MIIFPTLMMIFLPVIVINLPSMTIFLPFMMIKSLAIIIKILFTVIFPGFNAVIGPLIDLPVQGAGFKFSHFTVHEPSLGKPGAFRFVAPSQPAVIIATA